MFTKAYIPFRGYYSSPFAKWQGSLAQFHALELAASTVRRWLDERDLSPEVLDYLFLGYTIYQKQAFYGGPWVAAMLGAPGIPGIALSQACATSTSCLFQAAAGVELGSFETAGVVVCDRTSNGPHVVWPNPSGPGGEVLHENYLMDNFNRDPYAGNPMIRTAENVVTEMGATKAQLDEIAACRWSQYEDGLKQDRAFQKGYMFPVEAALSRKQTVRLDADEGITPATAEGLAKLRPVLEGGAHSFGAQTHPADGNGFLLVTTEDKARALSSDPGVQVQLCSYGFARVEKGFMPKAPVPAARMALEKAGIGIEQVAVVKTHNPFAANDLYFAREMGLAPESFNNYGSPLVFGHPQGPTAGRCVMELIEELALKGGGYGLFTGCAAGDTGAALVVKVST
ncbi:MAG: thiolase family protein [Deferrisomatales bacterium]|nr:thiolase family protein [Deferrisomatales bacterium]